MNADYNIDVQLAWTSGFLTPPICVCSVVVCMSGPAVALAMLDHLIQNQVLSPAWRSIWATAVLAGFGMVFYWYFHLIRTAHLDSNSSESAPDAMISGPSQSQVSTGNRFRKNQL